MTVSRPLGSATSRRRAAGVGVAIAMALSAVGTAAADCQGVEDMTENFLTVYPTGGPVARYDGARGVKVMEKLAVDRPADAVIFLYSGDGPVTGARGRYIYLVLDAAECVVNSGWVDGATYDRVVPAK